jgi:hypothetical protein
MTRPMNYVDCDVPEGMTLRQYRTADAGRSAGKRRRTRLRWLRLRRRGSAELQRPALELPAR